MWVVDERILEHLAGEDWGTPRTIAADPRLDEQRSDPGYIQDRIEELVARGLVEPIHDDHYEITDLGVMYLDGRLAADHLPDFRRL